MGTVKKIYLVHGWAYDTKKWGAFIDSLKKEGLSPILLTVPGLTEALSEIWTLQDYVDWLDKKVGKNQVILLGHSFGGRICTEYTRLHPENVSHLILVDSAGVYHNELSIRLKRTVFNFLAKAGKRVTSSPLLRSILYKLAREKDYNEANPNMKQTMVNMIESDKTWDITSIKTKTTIIWGENDRITPPSDAEYFHKQLVNSTIHVIKGTLHSPQLTHPERVSKIIRAAIS